MATYEPCIHCGGTWLPPEPDIAALQAENARLRELLAQCRVYVQTPLVYTGGTPATPPQLAAEATALLAAIDAAGGQR